MLQEHLPLPNGMTFQRHPLKQEGYAPQEPRKRTDWTRSNHALYAMPYRWARLARNQPNTTLARNINSGKLTAFDREYIIADAVKVGEEPDSWDIYARVRPKPRTTEIPGKPTQSEEDVHGLEVAKRRREWYDKHQLEWLTEESKKQE